MKVCVVGAGFTGLAQAIELQDHHCEVTIFDPMGLEVGASKAATGLMHPYIGETAYRSRLASEGMEASSLLFQRAKEATGFDTCERIEVIRVAEKQKTFLQMQKNCLDYQDVEYLGERRFLIKDAYVVFSDIYRQSLLHLFLQRKGVFEKKGIDNLEQVGMFDLAVFCTGYGSKVFIHDAESTYQFVKGQSLKIETRSSLQKAYVGKGYVCPTEYENIGCLGSTYEREFTHTDPDVAFAMNELLPKGKILCEDVKDATVISCLSGVRVCSKGIYLPKITKIGPSAYVITGMGSRGLLYHAYFARLFVKELWGN